MLQIFLSVDVPLQDLSFNLSYNSTSTLLQVASKIAYYYIRFSVHYLTIPRARMDSESIAYEAEGRMGY